MDHSVYHSPLESRYATEEMKYIFSDEYKIKTFRKLWVILAKEEKNLGLNITDEQIKDLEDHVDDIDYDRIAKLESETRHDVMANIRAYGEKAPSAKGIIHLGATSCYVDDNYDVLAMRDALRVIKEKTVQVVKNLREFALRYKGLVCLSYTHLQKAQPTTMGKRACLWMNDLLTDLNNLDYQLAHLLPLGCKGTTGTQASFVDLFAGDENKIKALDKRIANAMGFEESVSVSGQTYSRKQDAYILNVLASLGATCYKITNDIRVLQSYNEIEEPYAKTQVGSSAMPYKRNPMKSERVAGLSRHLMTEAQNAQLTHAAQFLERTLDDSSNRRLTIPDCFLTADSILNVMIDVTDGIVVHEDVISSRLNTEIPFIAVENILMEEVKRGGDRQQLHERLRVLSFEAKEKVARGEPNDLVEKIASDPSFSLSREEIDHLLNPKLFAGRAENQTVEFIEEHVDVYLKDNPCKDRNSYLSV